MESRKKGIAITAITALVAYKPTTYIEITVAVCVLIIACYAIRCQSKETLNKGEKNET